MTYCVISINFESLMLDHDIISCSRKLNFICEVVIMLVDYLKPRRNIVIMFVDYLKHCLFSNSLRCDTAPWLARRPACPWRRAGGAKHNYDHYDSDHQNYNDHQEI